MDPPRDDGRRRRRRRRWRRRLAAELVWALIADVIRRVLKRSPSRLVYNATLAAVYHGGHTLGAFDSYS